MKRKRMADLHVWTMRQGNDSVIASDAEDAWSVWCETTGEKREDYEREGEAWDLWPDDKPLKVGTDDGGPDETMIGSEWAKQGRGFFASTEH